MKNDEIVSDAGMNQGSTFSPAASKLIHAAMKLSDPLFAVIDGAHYDDLPRLLDHLEMDHRSLFLDHADAEIEKVSGWLVPILGRQDLEKLLSASDKDCSSLVLWACPFGEDALHRHLRTINIVEIPADAIPASPKGGVSGSDLADDEAIKPRYENVQFRHYDPNVLASLLPLLDEAQFARIFGPASHILMFASDTGQVRSAPRPELLPIAPRGPLTITSEQIDELETVRQNISQLRVVNYLREVAPHEAQRLPGHHLEKFVAESAESGRTFGLRSELAMGYWAYLNLLSDGNFAKSPVTRSYLMNYPQYGSPDVKVCSLMTDMSKMSDRGMK